MTENGSCNLSDDVQSSEIPLKKRKDTRLTKSTSSSWHIENSINGNPLKKKFFRSVLSKNEDESSPNIYAKKKKYFSVIQKDEDNLSIVSVPVQNTHPENLYSCLSNEDEKPSKKMADFEKDAEINSENKLVKPHFVNSKIGHFTDVHYLSDTKKSRVCSPSSHFEQNQISYKENKLPGILFSHDNSNILFSMKIKNSSTSDCIVDNNENSGDKKSETPSVQQFSLLSSNAEVDAIRNVETNENSGIEKDHAADENHNSNAVKLETPLMQPSSLLSGYVVDFCNSEIDAVQNVKTADNSDAEKEHSADENCNNNAVKSETPLMQLSSLLPSYANDFCSSETDTVQNVETNKNLGTDENHTSNTMKLETPFVQLSSLLFCQSEIDVVRNVKTNENSGAEENHNSNTVKLEAPLVQPPSLFFSHSEIDIVRNVKTNENSDAEKEHVADENCNSNTVKSETPLVQPSCSLSTFVHDYRNSEIDAVQNVDTNANSGAEKEHVVDESHNSNPGKSETSSVQHSSLLSIYLDDFCSSEIDAVPSNKTESLLSQGSQSHSSGVLEQQSTENVVSSSTETCRKITSSNISNPEGSQEKREYKYFGSSLDTYDFSKSPFFLEHSFSPFVFKEKNEVNTNFRPVDLTLSKSNEHYDPTSEISSNVSVSSSVGNSSILSTPLNFSNGNIPLKIENFLNADAGCSQENLCSKSSLLNNTMLSVDDEHREQSHLLQSKSSKDKMSIDLEREVSYNANIENQYKYMLPQLNASKDEENAFKKEIPAMFLNDEGKSCDSNKLKCTSSHTFSENRQEEGEDGFIKWKICMRQQENSSTDNGSKEEMLNDQNIHNFSSDNRSNDMLRSILMDLCEEELNSLEGTTRRDRCEEELNCLEETVERDRQTLQSGESSSRNLQDSLIDLCSNNDTTSEADDDDVKVIEILDVTDSVEGSSRTSRTPHSFDVEFLAKPSTSKCSPSLSVDFTNSNSGFKKSFKQLFLNSNDEDSNREIDKKKKINIHSEDPDCIDPNFCSVINSDSSLSICSSSSSTPCYDHDAQNSVDEEIFKSLKTVGKKYKRSSVIKRKRRSKAIPVITLSDDSSDEENVKNKKVEVTSVEKDNAQREKDSIQRPELECAICLESMMGQRGISSTVCGHVYCTACIEEVIEKKQECPTCRTPLNSSQVHKVFLFG